MEVLNLLNTNPELLNGLVYGPEGKKDVYKRQFLYQM